MIIEEITDLTGQFPTFHELWTEETEIGEKYFLGLVTRQGIAPTDIA